MLRVTKNLSVVEEILPEGKTTRTWLVRLGGHGQFRLGGDGEGSCYDTDLALRVLVPKASQVGKQPPSEGEARALQGMSLFPPREEAAFALPSLVFPSLSANESWQANIGSVFRLLPPSFASRMVWSVCIARLFGLVSKALASAPAAPLPPPSSSFATPS